MAVATKIREVAGFNGEAFLFKLDPPMEDGTKFVVSSAVDLDFGGIDVGDYRRSETMLFPASADGKVKSWGEVGFAPYKSHADALKDAGYTLIAQPVIEEEQG